jgi:hypothetical protein
MFGISDCRNDVDGDLAQVVLAGAAHFDVVEIGHPPDRNRIRAWTSLLGPWPVT